MRLREETARGYTLALGVDSVAGDERKRREGDSAAAYVPGVALKSRCEVW